MARILAFQARDPGSSPGGCILTFINLIPSRFISMDEDYRAAFQRNLATYIEENANQVAGLPETMIGRISQIQVSASGIVFFSDRRPSRVRKARPLSEVEVSVIYREGAKRFEEAVAIARRNRASGVGKRVGSKDIAEMFEGIVIDTLNSMF